MGNPDSIALSRRSRSRVRHDDNRNTYSRTDDFDYGEGNLVKGESRKLGKYYDSLRREEERLDRRELELRADRLLRRERELNDMEEEEHLELQYGRHRPSNGSYSHTRRTRSTPRPRYLSPTPVPRNPQKSSKMLGAIGATMMVTGLLSGGSTKKTLTKIGAGVIAAGVLARHNEQKRKKRMDNWEDGRMAYYESDTESCSTCSLEDDDYDGYERRGRSKGRGRSHETRGNRPSRIMRSISRGSLGSKPRPALTYPGYESPPPRYRSRC